MVVLRTTKSGIKTAASGILKIPCVYFSPRQFSNSSSGVYEANHKNSPVVYFPIGESKKYVYEA